MTRRTFTQSAVAERATVSEKQLAFISSLLDERDLHAGGKLVVTAETRAQVIEDMKAKAETLTRAQASSWIERLLTLPKVQIIFKPGNIDVPAGHYALAGPGEGHPTRFYKVSRPTEGRWAGRVFLSVQAGDEFHPIREAHARDNILSKIGQDPKASSVLYGKELGRCGVCNRTLTDEASRKAGIGPVCAEKF